MRKGKKMDGKSLLLLLVVVDGCKTVSSSCFLLQDKVCVALCAMAMKKEQTNPKRQTLFLLLSFQAAAALLCRNFSVLGTTLFLAQQLRKKVLFSLHDTPLFKVPENRDIYQAETCRETTFFSLALPLFCLAPVYGPWRKQNFLPLLFFPSTNSDIL